MVDKDFVIIVGHTRFEATKKLNYQKVPVVVADLPQNKAKAYRIADNRLNEDSGWNNELLNVEIQDLLNSNFNLDILGFIIGELDTLFS